MPIRRWAGLDGVRGCAVIAVVLGHLRLARSGQLGVDVFFVLSGFLITRLILSEYERTGDVSLRRFYLRRALRLYPALLAIVLFCVGVALVSQQVVAHTIHDAATALLYISNLFKPASSLLAHTWTLALEEQFYLLWPALLLVALRGRRRFRHWAFAPAWAVVAGIVIADFALGHRHGVHSYSRAVGLPLGCALAFARPAQLRRLSYLGWPAVAGLALVMAISAPNPMGPGGWLSVGALLAVPIVAMVIVRPVRIFESAVLRWFGLRSYSLYLWHYPLFVLARYHAPVSIPLLSRLAAAVIAALVAAELSYRLVEQPVLRFRERRVGVAAAVERAHEPDSPAPVVAPRVVAGKRPG